MGKMSFTTPLGFNEWEDTRNKFGQNGKLSSWIYLLNQSKRPQLYAIFSQLIKYNNSK